MTVSSRLLIVFAALVLSGCAVSTPERTSALPELVQSDMSGEANLFIYTDQKRAAETASRRGYNVTYPILDRRRQYQ
jgi:outer membrane PBP1 activator LpoA protein